MKTLKLNQSCHLQNVCFFLIYTVYTTLMCVLARVFVPRVTAFSRRNSSLIHFCKIVSALACGMYLLSCSFMPAYALADKNYRITDVNIYASLTTDGTLQVRERRTFEFKGSFKGVYWDLPFGNYEDRYIEPQDIKVSELATRDAQSGSSVSYEVENESTYKHVKVYSAHRNDHATFEISYKLPRVAMRYRDTSVLYWKFVSDGWKKGSNNVTCTIELPCPSGETVREGKNVQAWAHGPVDGSLAFNSHGIICMVPEVPSHAFAEVRILFPNSWLSAADQVEADKKESILTEERAWAQQTNREREIRLLAPRVLQIVLAAFIVLACIVRIMLWISKKRCYRPQFSDPYFRDVPSHDHPAVLGYLYYDKDIRPSALMASLMRLCDLGVCKLQPCNVMPTAAQSEVSKKDKQSYELIIQKDKDYLDTLFQNQDPHYAQCLGLSDIATLRQTHAEKRNRSVLHVLDIDKKAYDFLTSFVKVPKNSNTDEPVSYVGAHVSFADMHALNASQANASSCAKAYQNWHQSVESAAMYRAFFFARRSSAVSRARVCCWIFIVLATLLVCLSCIGWLSGYMVFDAMLLGELIAVCLVFCGYVYALKSYKALSQEAIEIRAKLHAFRRWALDFTRLKETIPTDLILWNRLLVLAVVLGVSSNLLKNIHASNPDMEIVDIGDDFMMYWWYASLFSPRMSAYTPLDDFSRGIDNVTSFSSSLTNADNPFGEASSLFGESGGFSGFGGGGGGAF